jgi:HEAT repeat protein
MQMPIRQVCSLIAGLYSLSFALGSIGCDDKTSSRTPGQGMAQRLRGASNSTDKSLACITVRDAPNAPELVEAVPELVEALADKEAAGNCSQALAQVGTGAASALVKALDDRRLTYWAMDALARNQSAEARAALPEVLERLKDTDAQIRWAALAAAANFVKVNHVSPTAVVPAIIDVLQHDQDSDPRGQAAFVLGEIGTTDAVAALKKAAVKDKDRSVRSDAKEALAKLAQ